jgi:hypothetical protein
MRAEQPDSPAGQVITTESVRQIGAIYMPISIGRLLSNDCKRGIRSLAGKVTHSDNPALPGFVIAGVTGLPTSKQVTEILSKYHNILLDLLVHSHGHDQAESSP